jgi:hypothetical protein
MEVEEGCCFLGCDATHFFRSGLTFQRNLLFSGWGQSVRLKYCYITTRRHGVTSRQTTVLSHSTLIKARISVEYRCRPWSSHCTGLLFWGVWAFNRVPWRRGRRYGRSLSTQGNTDQKKADNRGSVRKHFDMTYNFETEEPTLIVIISRDFVAERLSSVPSAEAKSWRPHI